MESKGRLNVRLNNPNPKRNSLPPSESEPSNQFQDSQAESENEEESSSHPPTPPPPPKKQRGKELKQSIVLPNAPPPARKNNNYHHPNPPPPEEKKVQASRGPEKRRNNFKSFEITSYHKPQAEPSPPPLPANNVNKKHQPQPKPFPLPPPPPPANNVNKSQKAQIKPSPLPPPPPPPAKNVNKSKVEQTAKESVQQRKVQQITKGMQRLSSSIHDMRDNYEQLKRKQAEVTERQRKKKRQDLSPFGVKMSPQKQQEIKQFITLKQQEKLARRKKLQDYFQREQHRLNLEQREKEMLRERERKRRLKQLKSLSKFQDKHEQWKQQFQEKQRQAEQFIKRYENQVKFHVRKQEEDKLIQKKRLQREKEILKERKDFYKSVQASEIEEHQKWYEDKLYELNREKLDAKEEQAQRIAEQNAAINEIWRGQSHGFVEEELLQLRKKKREPREKARRMREYLQHVRKNYLPKKIKSHTIDVTPARPTPSDSRLSHRQVKRYRYYKGVAYGEVVQNLPVAKGHKEQKLMGDNYLQFMKSLPKKREATPEQQLMLDPQQIAILQRKFNSVGKVRREEHSLYDDHRRKKTSIEVPPNPNRQDLKMIALQLKAHDQKLRQKQIQLNYQQHGKVDHVHGEQRAINQGLVQNIERKLSLLAQI